MLDLEFLAPCLGQGFVVGHELHEVGHVQTEGLDELTMADVLVFNGVVQVTGHHQVGVGTVSSLSQQMGDFGEVIEIRLCALALAALIAVAPRREIGGLRHADQVVGFAHGFLS